MDSLIRRVIDAEPPFRPGRSDAGFKDAVIWETLIQSNVKNDCAGIILFTSDNDFDRCRIPGANFKIIKSADELMDELGSIYGTRLRRQKYENLAKNAYLIANLRQLIASKLGHARMIWMLFR